MRRFLAALSVFCLVSQALPLSDAIFNTQDAKAGPDYSIRDFYVYPYNDNYYQAFVRLNYAGTEWRQYVKVTAVMFSSGKMVTSQQAYLDFATFGKYGMWPGSESYTHMFIDRVDFDSVLFSVSYNSIPLGTKFNRHAMAVISSVYEPFYEDTYKFSGLIQNMTGVSIDHPMLFVLAYKGGRLAAFNYTYADAPDYILGPAQLAAFSVYLEMPAGFDSVAYLTNYALAATGDIVMTGIEAGVKPETETVYITPTGSKYHILGCQYLSSNQSAIDLLDACKAGYTACSVCNPPSCPASALAGETKTIPEGFSLSQNYPNPFNASTSFTVWIDRSQEVRLQVFDLSGRMVRTAFSGSLLNGKTKITVEAGDLPSGTYLVVLSGEAERVVRKMVVVK